MSSTIDTRYHLAILQSQLLEWKLLQTQGLLERKEDWRDAEVVRDVTGRFASTGKTLSETAEAVKSSFSAEHLKQIEKSIHTSLSSGTLEARNILDNAFGKGAEAWRKEVADNFGDLTDGMKQAILKDPFPELTKKANDAIALLEGYKNKAVDAATQNAVSKEVTSLINAASAQYNKTIYDLEHLEDQPKVVQFLGKAAAELIPQAVFLGSFYLGGMFTNWLIFAAMAPAGVAAGGAVVSARIPPIAEITGQIARLVATNEAVILDRRARGVSAESLKDEPWWKKFGENARAALVYVFANAGLSLGIAAVDGTLLKFARGLVDETIAYTIAKRNIPDAVKATLNEVRDKLPEKRKFIEAKVAALADQYKDSKPMPTEIATHVYKKAADFEKKLLKQFKDVPDFPELLEAANINITKAIHEAEIHIRAPVTAVPSILNSRFKSTFENNFRNLKGYIQKRSRVEKHFFGLDKEWPPEERPIYGYFARPGNAGKLEGANTDGYGPIALKLKAGAKRRTTFLGHDSFWAHDMGSVTSPHDIPTVGTFLSGKESKAETVMILSALAKAKDIEGLREVAGRIKIPGTKIAAKSSYIETVIHGGVDASDIEEVIFTLIPKNKVSAFEKLAMVRASSGQDLGDETLNAIVDTINIAREKGMKVTFGG